MAAHKIYFHLTWSTHRRQPMIDAGTRDYLEPYFRRVAKQERVTIIAMAFLKAHVHLLVRSGPKVDLSRLVQLVKGGSSYAASRQRDNKLGLRWNPEYSVTSVSPRLLPVAERYIALQNEHHPAEAISPKHLPV